MAAGRSRRHHVQQVLLDPGGDVKSKLEGEVEGEGDPGGQPEGFASTFRGPVHQGSHPANQLGNQMAVAIGLLGLEKRRMAQEIQLDAIQIVVLDDLFDDLVLVLPYLLIGEIESGGKTGMDGVSQQQFRVSLLVLTVEIDGVPTLGTVVGVIHPHGHEELDADLAAAIGHGLKVVLPLLENALQTLDEPKAPGTLEPLHILAVHLGSPGPEVEDVGFTNAPEQGIHLGPDKAVHPFLQQLLDSRHPLHGVAVVVVDDAVVAERAVSAGTSGAQHRGSGGKGHCRMGKKLPSIHSLLQVIECSPAPTARMALLPGLGPERPETASAPPEPHGQHPRLRPSSSMGRRGVKSRWFWNQGRSVPVQALLTAL